LDKSGDLIAPGNYPFLKIGFKHELIKEIANNFVSWIFEIFYSKKKCMNNVATFVKEFNSSKKKIRKNIRQLVSHFIAHFEKQKCKDFLKLLKTPTVSRTPL
jgi:mevalonate kinase